ncbi:MAG TPA: GNAT family N-acetyltransferase [Xanthobacteraceae bacterium]
MSAPPRLRPYRAADEEVAIELWRRSWQHSYPDIDFSARLSWWRERWRKELVPSAKITLAERADALVGFVTIDPATGYLDQIVVAPEAWGGGVAEALLAEAKRICPEKIELHVNKDNARAIGFYDKHGFVVTGESTNPLSGRPVFAMRWERARAEKA